MIKNFRECNTFCHNFDINIQVKFLKYERWTTLCKKLRATVRSNALQESINRGYAEHQITIPQSQFCDAV